MKPTIPPVHYAVKLDPISCRFFISRNGKVAVCSANRKPYLFGTRGEAWAQISRLRSVDRAFATRMGVKFAPRIKRDVDMAAE